MTQEQEQYMKDEMYTPIFYKGIQIQKPLYKGKGNHSLSDLERICEEFEEYCHQQQIIKQSCMKYIIELAFKTPKK